MTNADEVERNLRHTEAMRALKVQRTELMKTKAPNDKGVLIVNTGEGKGKSTAAFGVVARAIGWGMKVGVVQFIKGKWVTGEKQFFQMFPEQVRFESMGEGFTWDTQDRTRDVVAAERAWSLAKQLIDDPEYDLVVLDELNIALRYDYLDIGAVVDALEARPLQKHVLVTGRNAKPELIAIADLVTEMKVVRHPFDNGYQAQRGIDF